MKPAGQPAPTAPGPKAGLTQWLRWLEGLHSSAIDLGLERLRPVCQAMGLDRPPFRVLTVAGTNGKGSSVAVAAALLTAAGHRVGSYTSPHLIDFNERICIDGLPASDAEILQAFQAVEAARGAISLSYFEYTTLAALAIFRQRGVSHAVLEVGLGGRLDAVNVIDADVALLTRVALDHAEWLGNDLAGIAREKAGVCRPSRPVVVADRDGPLAEAARETGARPLLLGKRDFVWGQDGDSWFWESNEARLDGLGLEPWWHMPWQRANAAAAMQAVSLLAPEVLADAGRVRQVLSTLQPPGRVQRLAGQPETLLDVAHNPDAALALMDYLRARPVNGQTRAIIGMRADKDIAGVVTTLAGEVDEWWPADLSAQGGLSAEGLDQRIHVACPAAHTRVKNADPVETWLAARASANPGDRLLVLGSFMTVGPVLRQVDAAGHTVGIGNR
ncbi:bifunctional tetrahydrofolate synthase/dihydrofolate synthase [Gammaproteobacteria bacterium AB-CW1]|uniref:Dihydrofolate synthase/folylpolyglutamate synthase n=1 Tax=Natronospira elongata TaxID=3110268 RepID=A0AAP6JDJ6_9GAMM|nr:bifunctional tetrahydrofolate synthase/dihydrofolate synthase [Gammaproteobacteria bacterium AB-CW1]